MKLATVRVLESMPPGMTVDSDPIKVGPEVISPRPDKRAWGALPPRECKICYGRGLIDTIVREPGEPPLRVKKPCACVWQGIALAEKLEQGRPDGVKVVLASEIRAADDLNLRRYARVLKDLAREQAKLDKVEAAKAAAMAPYLTRQGDAQSGVVQVLADLDDLVAELEGAESAVTTAEEEVRTAIVVLADVIAQRDEAAAEIHNAHIDLATFHRLADEFGVLAATAGASGGKRHRIQTQTRRISDLRDRLAAIKRDIESAGLTVPEPETAPAVDSAAAPEVA